MTIDYVAMTIGGHYLQLAAPVKGADPVHWVLAAIGQGVGRDTVFKRHVLPQTHAGSTTVAFMSHSGHYLEARPGDDYVGASATQIGPAQTFEETWLPDDRIALRTSKETFLTADGGGGEAVVTDRTAVGEWEKFYYEVVPVGLLPVEFRPGAPHPGGFGVGNPAGNVVHGAGNFGQGVGQEEIEAPPIADNVAASHIDTGHVRPRDP